MTKSKKPGKTKFEGKSYEDLARMVESDPSLKPNLIRFLGPKKAPKARALLAELQGKPRPAGGNTRPMPPAPPVLQPTSVSPGGRRPGDRASGPARVAGPQTADELETLRTRVAIFEKIYGRRGELLARWGMTDAMPDELRDRVFEMWREELAGGPKGLSRDLRRLEDDVRALAST
jgi:hypothetical protein